MARELSDLLTRRTELSSRDNDSPHFKGEEVKAQREGETPWTSHWPTEQGLDPRLSGC